MGMTHEGTNFGVPVWAAYDENHPDDISTMAKWAPLEAWITLCCYALQFLNSFRPPGEEVRFPFLLKPIHREESV